MTARLVGKPPSPLPSLPRRSQSNSPPNTCGRNGSTSSSSSSSSMTAAGGGGSEKTLRYAAASSGRGADTQRAFRRTQSMPTTPLRKWRARRRELSGSFTAAVASNAASGTIYTRRSSAPAAEADGDTRSAAGGGPMRRWTATSFFLVVAAQLFVKGMVNFSVSSSSGGGQSDESDGGIMNGMSPARRLATAKEQQQPLAMTITDGARIATQTDVFIRPYGKAARALRGSSSLAGADSTSKRRGRGAKSSSPSPPPTMGSSLLVGIVRNATSIVPENMALLAELACKHNTESHILAAHGAADALEAMRLLMTTEDQPARAGRCAEVSFVQEPSDILEGVNQRVDRIALLRDYQRSILARRRGGIPSVDDYGDDDRSPPAKSDTEMAEGVVIVTDLDLDSLPPADDIMEEAHAMIHDGREDIVCAAGVMHHPFGYYDIFATVLLPNTFVYPVEGRFRPVVQDDEDSAFIISDDLGLKTSFTQNDLFQYLTDASTREHNGRPVPVRSCFGGLAIYRSSVWYEPKCQYGSWRSKCAPHMARYANQADKRPCEHVSFHECLREVIPATSKGAELSIGIQPRLMPHWNSNNEIFTSELTSDGNNAIVATHNQAHLDNRPGLGAFAAKESSRRRLNEASSLLTSSNKKYHLRIDPLHGHLLLENHERKGVESNPTVVWKAAAIETETPAASWMMPDILVRSSLTIRRGAIVLEREVVNSRDDGMPICDSMQRTCRFEIWSSNSETNSDQRDILTLSTSSLALSDTGSLSLVNKQTQQISWTATEDITWTSCPSQIPSTFRLHQGDTICSPNNQYRLGLQEDGLFVWKATDVEKDGAETISASERTTLASFESSGPGPVIAHMQGDGNLVILRINENDEPTVVWSSNTSSVETQGAHVELFDDGSVGIVNTEEDAVKYITPEANDTSSNKSSTSVLGIGKSLRCGDAISSPKGEHSADPCVYDFGLSRECVLELRCVESNGKSTVLWSAEESKSAGEPSSLIMQDDGNLVLYGRSMTDSIWSTQTLGSSAMLSIKSNGKVEMRNLEDEILWYLSRDGVVRPRNVLRSDEELSVGDLICSPQGSFCFGLHEETQDLRLWRVPKNDSENKNQDKDESSVIFALEDGNLSDPSTTLVMQDDGNLVLRTKSDVLWTSESDGGANHGSELHVLDYGAAEIRNQDGIAIRTFTVGPRIVLKSDEELRAGEYVCSPEGSTCFGIHEETQDLRLWRVTDGDGKDESSVIFALEDGNLSDVDASLIMQDDGNLVLRTKSDVLWTSESDGDANHGSELHVLDYDAYGAAEIRNQQDIAIQSFALKNSASCARWLFGEEWLRGNKKSICSPNGKYKLRLSPENQDLAVFDDVGSISWSLGIESDDNVGVHLQNDGNLIYEDKEGRIIWHSGVTTRSSNGVGLTITDDGAVMLFDFDGTLIWSSDDEKLAADREKKAADDTHTLSSLYLPGCGCADALYPGQLLNLTTHDLSLCSPDASHRFGFDSGTGDLSIWHNDEKVWSRGLFSQQKEAHRTAELTHGGNLIVREGRLIVIDTGTDADAANAGATMSIDNDGMVRLENSKGKETILFNPLHSDSPGQNDKSPLIADESKYVEVIDSSSLKEKVLTGYQGWFTTPCDDGLKRWHHWSNRVIPDDKTVTVDMWPTIDEYGADELCDTDFVLQDDTKARLFSSYNPKTVDRHIKWMSEYGIDGAVVQRFIADIRVFRHMRDQVLKNVQASSERYGRVFANMYDITGLEPSPSILEDIMNDWKHLVDGLKVTESPRYLRSNNLPVLGVYFGKASETPLTAKETSTLIDWLQNNPEERYRATVIGAGLGKDWRTMSSPNWRAVYQKLDVISPWTVGLYGDEAAYDQHYKKFQASDVEFCHNNKQEYLPVVYPGFSAKQIMDGKPMNEIPRNGGEFLWRQLFQSARSGAGMVYVAMFDEYDEGTAIMKAAAKKKDAPTNGEFVTFDVDKTYQEIPNDWYLRLVGEATKLFRKDAKNFPDTIPIQVSVSEE